MKKKYSISRLSASFRSSKSGTCSLGDPQDEIKVETRNVSIFELFRFATCLDIVYITICLLTSVAAGAIQPFVYLFFGDMTGDMIDFAIVLSNSTVSEEELQIAEDVFTDRIADFSFKTTILAVVTIVLVYIGTMMVSYSAVRQMSKLRSVYMESILNKDISWYDTHQTGDFASRITEDLSKVEEAVGDKLATFVYYMAIFISGLIFSFIKGWELALICLIYLPVSMIGMGAVSWLSNKLVKKETDAYGAAAAIADEVLGSIRTVVAFEGQKTEIERYRKCLVVAKENNVKRALFTAISNGMMWLFIYGSYALSFYYGVTLILDERNLPESERVYTPANMITVFVGILVATWNFGFCTQIFQIFAVARGAASKIYAVIDEPPILNLSKNNGKKFVSLSGNIRFENVHFQYPSRPAVKVLQGLNLSIKSGETVALVGSSGCGKSTCIQLIQRFYDPVTGNVNIDGMDLRDYDLRWIRSQIGVVGQEPILFGTTIEENIKYGNPYATQQEVEEAAKKANAHSFIKILPQGYETLVGERGAQLSGGQKQRIAIARALIRRPAILLLDEATSALDTSSEAQVQAALDSASVGCTTVIIAHRLSTIRNANRIVVFSEGKIVEEGSHDQLMNKKGVYYNLFTAQITDNVLEKENDNISLKPNGSGNFEMSQKLSLLPEEQQVYKLAEKHVSIFKTMGQVLMLNKPEWFHIIAACLGAAVAGATLPLYSIVFGDIVGVLSDEDDDYVRSERNKFCMIFAIIGVVTGIAAFLQWYLFGISGEKLTMRARLKLFETMLKQEMGWYDVKENGTGALCSRLASDASGIQGASGQSIGTVVNSLSSLGLAIGFSIYYEWRLTLVTLSLVPCMFLAIYFEQKVTNYDTFGSHDAIESSSKVAVEAISNIRTVASLGLEKNFHTMYLERLGPHYNKARRNRHIRGLVLGMARSLMSFAYAVSIYYGGHLIRTERLSYEIVFKVSEALVSGAWAVGNALAFTPNFQNGINSSARLFELLRLVPAIKDTKHAKSLSWVDSTISYNNIYFSYPTRASIQILRGLNLEVLLGKTVALVGPSGCGKSTIIQLLERFYDPNVGEVCIDKRNLKSIKLSSLRAHLGIVSQEPNLFDRTISENIAYGDNSRIVPQREIMEAAKNANIHNYISSLPLGYDTRLGEKGTQLSGGQKQRIAIARALIRNPQVLLLDEATSALDTESEKIVQEALDNAKAGRTCITIAHRLLTIQEADVICVIDKGVVTEMGSHSELLSIKGLYYKLWSMQMGHR